MVAVAGCAVISSICAPASEDAATAKTANAMLCFDWDILLVGS